MIYPNIPVVALSATITRNVLEYIRVTLRLRSLVHLYKKTLDRPNITYMVYEITKPGFGELDMLIPKGGGVADVLKTMIFVNSINGGIEITM